METDERTVIVDEIYLITLQAERATLQTKLQLAKSTIQTILHELDEGTIFSCWLGEHLRGVLEDLK